MNRDMSLIRRALIAAGQEPLNDEDVANDTVRWRTVKALYLPTLLGVIASAEWTELKRRHTLARIGNKNLSARSYIYALPDDCARAIALTSEEAYEVEGAALYTNDAHAVLLYVSNGRKPALDWQLSKTDKSGTTYGDAYDAAGTHYDMYVKGGAVQWISTEDDYPDYRALKWSPEFVECFTMTLASEFALKITADKQLYGMLMQLAAAAREGAEKVSRTKGANRTQAQRFWGERLGIPSRSV